MALESIKVNIKKPRFAWLNNRCVPWDDCVLHVRTQAVHFGSNVFEGVRAYWSEERGELYVFKLDEHLRRLEQGMKIMRMKPPLATADIARGVVDLLRENGFRENVHMTVTAYFGESDDFDPLFATEDTGAHITAVPFDRVSALSSGITACVSSWRRISDDSVPPRIKVGANYQNSRLAQQEARMNGYHTAVMLNQSGKVSETPGACLMMVRDGRLITPPVTADILESVTRGTLMQIASEDLKIPVIERDVDRTELYLADELIVCGTIAEVVPMISVDRLPVGDGAAGPITRSLRERYFTIVRGGDERYASSLTPVYGAPRPGSL
ncbi:MAG TPA: branched-chain amino acid transaminase [Candidatus Nanopelagicales bacterium]|nr:branched-chain amino acid transaminase [Candidatus Nanopelagicales bacterium]